MSDIDEFSPIDALRQQAAIARETPPGTTEYGLGTRSLPVTSSEEAPLVTRVRGFPSTYGPLTPGRILDDIHAIEPTLSRDEWRRFRIAVGRLLGFVLPHGDHDDDHE